MRRARFCVFAAAGCAAAGVIGTDVRKQVVNTAWWPPGTEKKSESVGIISHGFVFMTAMMETNTTVIQTVQAELSDVQDIAVAAGSDLSNVVDCLANAPRGGAALVREKIVAAFRQRLPATVDLPALTVVEVPGEYAFFNTSVSCVAAVPGSVRTPVHADGGYGVSSRGLLHLEASGTGPSVLRAVAELVAKAGGSGLQDVAECIAFLQDIRRDAAWLRRSFAVAAPAGRHGPVLSVVQAGLEPGKTVALRCVAAVPLEGELGGAPLVDFVGNGIATTRRLAFVEGQFANLTNGTDGFDRLDQALSHAGVGLADVVSCLFFVADQGKVFDLFAGFYDVFNLKNPPPPARGELQAKTECGHCQVLMRCVAALPCTASALAAERAQAGIVV